MKPFVILAAGVVVTSLSGTAAFAQSDQTFITEAIQGNLAEIQMGQLAQKNAASQEVKDFGQMLVTDHGQGNAKAAQVAQSLNVTPPSEPTAKQKSEYDRLSKLNGNAFDVAFARHMVADHKKDIAAFKKESKSKDASVASFASDTLPTLQKHLKSAQALEKNEKAAALRTQPRK